MTSPKPKSLHQSEVFCISLTRAFRPNHPMVQLAEQIPWELFEGRFGELHCLDNGHPGLLSRVMVVRLLKHARGFSDDEVVEWWLDAQYFYEESHFQQESQMDSSRLSRFRSHIGKSGCELILQSIVIAGLGKIALKRSDLNRVTVDTTLQENAVTYPTDAMLSYAGHNMRIILKKIRIFCADFWRQLIICFGSANPMLFLAFRSCRSYA